jgi:hypothetical protein
LRLLSRRLFFSTASHEALKGRQEAAAHASRKTIK